MKSAQPELEVIVGQRFRVIAVKDIQRDRLYLPSNKRSHESQLLLRGKFSQDVVSLARYLHWNLVVHGCSRRAGPRRVCEHVQISERQLLDHATRLLEIRIGLAGESDHYIGADCSAWHSSVDFLDLLPIMPWPVLAMHRAQHAITSGLHGNVRMLGDAR